jgi:asparagine synthase (glutamine-hydrolysing)
MRHQLYSNAFKARLGSYSAAEVFRRHAGRAGTDDPFALVQYLDLKTYLVGDINTKVDRASMAHSLEVREPLMDHPLVEWLASLPSSLKVRGHEGKYLLKKAMEPHLPSEICIGRRYLRPLERCWRGRCGTVVGGDPGPRPPRPSSIRRAFNTSVDAASPVRELQLAARTLPALTLFCGT